MLIAILMLPLAACAQSTTESPEAWAERIRSEADKAHPNNPVEAALETNAKAQDRLADTMQSRPDIRRKLAAASFMAYYTKYVYSIPAICSGAGVSLGAWSRGFKEANQGNYELALSLGQSVLVGEMKDAADRFAQGELDRMKAAWNLNLLDTCKYLEDNHELFAEKATFAAASPEANKVLNEQ